jgi:uncharacterized protein (TIRG00374 family)
MLIWALSQVEIRAAVLALSSAPPSYVTTGIVLITAAHLVSAGKWRLILGQIDIAMGVAPVLALYFMSIFFCLIFPSTVGGDVLRLHKMVQDNHRPVDSALSIAVDRFTGFYALMLLGAVALFYNPGLFGTMLPTLILAVGIPAGLCTIAVFYPRSAMAFMDFAAARLPGRWQRGFGDFKLSHEKLFAKRRQLAFFLFLSSIGHLLMVGSSYMFLRAAGGGISVDGFFVIFPVVALLSNLPVSFNGLGIRELSYIVFLERLGVAPSVTFSFSVISFIVNVGFGLAGAILYLLYPSAGTRKRSSLKGLNDD